MGQRAGLDDVERKRFPPMPEIEPRLPLRPARNLVTTLTEVSLLAVIR
jgi:hypothetical protein